MIIIQMGFGGGGGGGLDRCNGNLSPDISYLVALAGTV